MQKSEKKHFCENGQCYPVDEMWYNDMRLDHFSYTDDRRFPLRWVRNMTFYKDGGPIFFYTGNEGDLDGFIAATGMIFDLAPNFNAAIIFAEHRFYGKTQPFGNNSYANVGNMGYLTSEQALADFADLLWELKTPNNRYNFTFPASTPIISFGGSYGGMLSAWFRIKYPHLITGAWAGSAPLIYFRGSGVNPGIFDNITSRTYVDAGCKRDMLSGSWNAILRMSNTSSGRDWLNKHFSFDPRTPINSTDAGYNLIGFFQEAVEYMAMTDYPYPTNFLMPLPAWPVQYSCQYMNASPPYTDEQLVTAIGNVAAVYYNTSGNTTSYCIDPSICGDQGTGGLGDDQLGWPWQECSEIVMWMCTLGGDNDVFPATCDGDPLPGLLDYCSYAFTPLGWKKDIMNVDAIAILYGLNLNGASNIILTQGHLDPWSGGGYRTDSPGVDPARGIYVVEIPGSAHHLDLRTPNTCDPNTITNARYQISSSIRLEKLMRFGYFLSVLMRSITGRRIVKIVYKWPNSRASA
ncbi:hypothetical protein WR25_11696 [Diploscapter pachys]|uniref:Serine carboxypeptidase S28 n=1 Tax=Diploscapter pachys TaxID=2018661 RepID=A0A2A2KP83_9BILA|nr:hypothetical protein WR25_11696 [Diploscapter pachys]